MAITGDSSGGLFGLAFAPYDRRDKKRRAGNSTALRWSGPLDQKTLFDSVFGFLGAGTSAPARLLTSKEITDCQAYNRTALLISVSQRPNGHTLMGI